MKTSVHFFILTVLAAGIMMISGCCRTPDKGNGRFCRAERKEPAAGMSTEAGSSNSSFIPYSRAYAVRRLNWGYSMEDVRDCETAMYKGGSESFLLYEDNLCGQKARIMHSFENGRLDCVLYDISGSGMDEDAWNKYVMQVKDYLSVRYGPPDEDYQTAYESEMPTETAYDSPYGGIPGYVTIWRTDRCYICMHDMSDEENGSFLSVVFADPAALGLQVLSETETEEQSRHLDT